MLDALLIHKVRFSILENKLRGWTGKETWRGYIGRRNHDKLDLWDAVCEWHVLHIISLGLYIYISTDDNKNKKLGIIFGAIFGLVVLLIIVGLFFHLRYK